jgi:hypothetical protein
MSCEVALLSRAIDWTLQVGALAVRLGHKMHRHSLPQPRIRCPTEHSGWGLYDPASHPTFPDWLLTRSDTREPQQTGRICDFHGSGGTIEA